MRLIVVLLLTFFCRAAYAVDVSIGVYYFPGWKSEAAWEKIIPYPERKPLLGWYKEGEDSVMGQQLDWMATYGIDFVVFDWYWRKDKVAESHAIEAFKRNAQSAVKYSILWANHDADLLGLNEIDRVAEYWIDNYFNDKRFLAVDGKPVVVILAPRNLEMSAKKAGYTTSDLLERVRSLAKKRNLGGVYFIAASHAIESVVQDLSRSGYDAVTAYNYHFGLSGVYRQDSPPQASHSFQELSDGYSTTWDWFARRSPLPYWLPVTAGWDKRPWGGSADPSHDRSEATNLEFGEHLQNAKAMISKGGGLISSHLVVCCWNEFGEGSYIEPTQGRGFSFLEKIRRVKLH